MRNKIITAVLAACSVTAGCSSSPSPVPAAGTSAPAAPAAVETSAPTAKGQLRAAAQAYSDAFLTGQATAGYTLLSERCRKRTSPERFAAMLTAAQRMYGTALPFVTFAAAVSGDSAQVSYTFSVTAVNQLDEPWVREDGNWRQDGC
ncbi:hypothetical protein [Actinoplanes sp. GCM10030250]|uniref:hypothetical protein n=1 Tax=Actinoplanes sp. GCM10030250 TaxID=3273376 RepID=UPI003620003B